MSVKSAFNYICFTLASVQFPPKTEYLFTTTTDEAEPVNEAI